MPLDEDPRRTKGWFSRRHPTNAEHIAAGEKYRRESARHKAKAARREKQYQK